MSTPVDADTLSAIVAAAESAGAGLHLLRPDQVYDLATAADQAQRAEVEDVAWQAELGYWTGGTRLLGSGIPDSAIGDHAPQTTVPGRDFGHHGDLPISEAHENAARFAVLYGPGDGKLDWLRAGETLSAAWLTAIELGVSVVPLSATIEVAATREHIRCLLADLGHPQLVLRFSTPDPAGTAPPAHPAATHRTGHRASLNRRGTPGGPRGSSPRSRQGGGRDMTVPKLQTAPDAVLASASRGEPADAGRTSTDAVGLSSGEAAARLARDGGNVLPSPRPTPLWRRIVAQLRDPLVLVLLAAAGFTLATADFTDASVIMLVIVVNTTVGVLQEIKAERAITALSALTAPAARLVRDGRQREVPAADLVIDDLLVLAEGDVVPADARVVESVALLVDEAALTGESVPVDKSATTGRGTAAPASTVVSA
nr:hypothetical protein GCM10020092_080260 [Actinoplanes digitatis]